MGCAGTTWKYLMCSKIAHLCLQFWQLSQKRPLQLRSNKCPADRPFFVVKQKLTSLSGSVYAAVLQWALSVAVLLRWEQKTAALVAPLGQGLPWRMVGLRNAPTLLTAVHTHTLKAKGNIDEQTPTLLWLAMTPRLKASSSILLGKSVYGYNMQAVCNNYCFIVD